MIRTILVPLDATRFAEAALPVASRLGRDGSARLHLLLSHQPVGALAGMAEQGFASLNLEEESRHEEHGYLTDTAADLVAHGIGSVECIETDGPAGPAICAEATRIGADLVIMAAHGRGATGRLLHGSVADYVIRHLSVPVLLIEPDRAPDCGATFAPRGILVALDLSPQSEAILGMVRKVARLLDAPVTLFHVLVDPGLDGVQASAESVRATAQARLDQLAGTLRLAGLTVSTRLGTGTNVAGAIRDAIKDSSVDLAAMTTSGACGLKRLWIDSVADQMIQGADQAVLVLKA